MRSRVFGARVPSEALAKEGGFTLIEMIVVVFLLAIAMLGILSVFDASARINKSEQDVADWHIALRCSLEAQCHLELLIGDHPLLDQQFPETSR